MPVSPETAAWLKGELERIDRRQREVWTLPVPAAPSARLGWPEWTTIGCSALLGLLGGGALAALLMIAWSSARACGRL